MPQQDQKLQSELPRAQSGATPSVTTFHSRVTRAESLQDHFRKSDTRVDQISRGPLVGELSGMEAGAVRILDVRFNRSVRIRGQVQPDVLHVAAISASGDQSVCRGHKVRRGQLVILSPGETVHHVAAAESRSLVAMIRPDDLWAAARTLLQCEPSWRLAGKVAVQPHPEAQRELKWIMRAAVHRAKQGSVSSTAVPLANRSFEHAVLHRVVRALSSAYPMEESEIGHTRRLQMLKGAEDLMVSRMEGALTIFDLCATLQVSERTLHYAFRDVCGMSPMAYYKSLRLNEIRRHLQRADPRRTSISEVVECFGFRRPGNLAADYKRQFGELPSQTLRR